MDMVARRRNQVFRRKTPTLVHRFEREMTRLGRQQFDHMARLYRERLIPSIAPQKTSFFDADEDELRRIQQLLDMLSNDGQRDFSRAEIERRIRGIMNQLDSSVRSTLENTFGLQTIGSVFDREIESIINRTVGKTATDFKISNDRTARLLNERITSGLVAGERHQSIAKGISSLISGDSDERVAATNRAKFIARNTVSRSLGEINKVRQVNNNIPLYMWQTSEDERVRPTHQDLNGKVFSWEGTVVVGGKTYHPASDPGYNGGAPTIPGMPYNCRCVGLAYVPELE
jgi:SPP1 gp7 family putative phage head morphogenesis protein